MENRAHALIAGLFVLLLGAAVAAVALWMQRGTRPLVSYVIVTTKSVSGLKVEAPVRFRGLDVGKVETMRFDPSVPGEILVTIGVDADTPLTRTTYAKLGYQGVTGLAFIELNESGAPGATSSAPLAPGSHLSLQPSLMDSGADLLATVREVANRVNAVLDPSHRESLQRALDGVAEATQKTAQLAEGLEASARRLPALLGAAQGVTRRADLLMDQMSALASHVDQRVAAIDSVHAAADRVAVAADRTGSAARSVDENAVPRLDALMAQLQHETRALDRLLVMLSDAPQSVVFGRPLQAPGPGERGFALGGSQ